MQRLNFLRTVIYEIYGSFIYIAKFLHMSFFFRFKVYELEKIFGRDGHPDMRAQVTIPL